MESISNLIILGFGIMCFINLATSWKIDDVMSEIKDIKSRLSNIEKRLEEKK